MYLFILFTQSYKESATFLQGQGILYPGRYYKFVGIALYSSHSDDCQTRKMSFIIRVILSMIRSLCHVKA